MKKISLFALSLLVATCSATAHIPELRMTQAEITSGDKGESQIGSSKLAGVHTKIWPATPPLRVSIPFCYSSHHARPFKLIRIVTTAWRRSCPGPGFLDMERILTRTL
jgi:hypothetical protein